MNDPAPIVRCSRCNAWCNRYEFLIIVAWGVKPRDDMGRFDPYYCERCYCTVGAGGRQKWERAWAQLRCSCTWRTNLFSRERSSEPCDRCVDDEWYLTNLDLVIGSLKSVLPPWGRKPPPAFKAFNRWGRCLQWE